MAAGAIATPKILMLSGIGPAEHLAEHGIAALRRPARRRREPAGPYRDAGRGASATARTATSATTAAAADAQRDRVYREPQRPGGLERRRGGRLLRSGRPRGHAVDPAVLRAERLSRQGHHRRDRRPTASPSTPASSGRARKGSIRLASADPAEQPLIDPNYLADPEDVRLSIGGVRRAREIMAQAPLRGMIEREIFPGPEKQLRRGARRARPAVREDGLPSLRHLPHGARRRSRRGGLDRPAAARGRGAAGRRCLGDADDHQRQHQRRGAGGRGEGGGVHARQGPRAPALLDAVPAMAGV